MAETSKDFLVGVDLGGTMILAGVFDDKLNCLGRSKMSTKSFEVSAIVVYAFPISTDSTFSCSSQLRSSTARSPLTIVKP